MNKEIKYIGFYDIAETKNNRVATIAATNKMDYICTAINRAGFDVHLVSPSWVGISDSKTKYASKTTLQLSPKKRITFCPSYNTKSKWGLYIKITFTLTWLFFWLIFNVRRDEKILVYHVQWLSLPIRWAKKIKGFKLILEVEEIYGKVWKNKALLQKWEKKLIKDADYFIAVSDILAEILGERVKAIIYGNYSLPDFHNNFVKTDTINVIYAGSIDHTKGGAYNAVKCAYLLPENYKIHICGFGDSASILELEQEIMKVNAEQSREACLFHGLIPDNQFSDFLYSCQIAINPQQDGENMTTLFPSKIIKYLSHNLRVVSTRIKSIDKSAIASLIAFSENDQPEAIVKTILDLDINSKFNSREILNELDIKFVNLIQKLLENE